jgi:hypothetical protein
MRLTYKNIIVYSIGKTDVKLIPKIGTRSTFPKAKLNAVGCSSRIIFKKLKQRGAETLEKFTVVNNRLAASV